MTQINHKKSSFTNTKILQQYKIFTAIIFLLFIIFLAGWVSYKTDTIIEQKASSMTMIQTLSATLKAVERCWTDNRVDVAECDSAKASLTKTTDNNINYFITTQGLIGIDYKHHNFVLLTAQKMDNSMTWKCFGHPKKSLPKLCDPVTSNAQE
ncbi:hypothetical protein [Paracidovorax avenae]|uniref:hypothetical protein n=1 Tax=Paracidovorax avenae TaxID=80867 RepID=UPI0012FE058E|nr:hypothetical protein [Paracidovorax avenae]